jgi:hypothetical protein
MRDYVFKGAVEFLREVMEFGFEFSKFLDVPNSQNPFFNGVTMRSLHQNSKIHFAIRLLG